MTRKCILRVKYEAPGFHRWKDAPKGREYLRDLHRHVFGFIVEVEVTELNRELEYHTLEDVCLTETKYMLNNMKATTQEWSCEHMAEYLFTHLFKMGYDIESVEASEEWKYCSVVRRHE